MSPVENLLRIMSAEAWLITTLVVAATLIGLAVVGAFLFRRSKLHGRRRLMAAGLVVLIALCGLTSYLTVIVYQAGLVFVPPERCGVVYKTEEATNVRQEKLDPGLHWILPLEESVAIYSGDDPRCTSP